MKQKIKKDLEQTIKKVFNLEIENVHLEHPDNSDHGDFASNFAMVNFKKIKGFKNPLELAEKLKQEFPKKDYLEKISILKPGFINFYLSEQNIIVQTQEILKQKNNYGKNNLGKGKKILLEHTSPDPNKPLHVGHLRNNFLGMSVSNILKFSGYKVKLDCIVNNRGTHISRSIWGYLAFGKKNNNFQKDNILNLNISDQVIKKIGKESDWKNLLNQWSKNPSLWLAPKDLNLKSDRFYALFYALGDKAEQLVPNVQNQVKENLLSWEAKEKPTWKIWKQIINECLEGQKQTYKMIGSHHDYWWYEHKLYQGGKELVKKGIKKKIFRKGEGGAMITNLKEYNLPDTVIIKSDGTSVYHTFDINLTLQKTKKFPSDLYIWDIGNDQILYLKQLFAICEQLGIEKKENLFHLNYGYVSLHDGERMRSRQGNVILTDDLVNNAFTKIKKIVKKSNHLGKNNKQIIKIIGIGALKYGLLKYSREADINFDLEKSTSLEGNSGPYLQYTYTRGKSILKKSKTKPKIYQLKHEKELNLARELILFPEIIKKAGKNYSPNLICNYLFKLAQTFNNFYESVPVLKADLEVQKSRLALVKATTQVLENGLKLLGIEVPEKM